MVVQPKEKFLLLLSFKLAVVLNFNKLTPLENWFEKLTLTRIILVKLMINHQVWSMNVGKFQTLFSVSDCWIYS